MCGVAQDTTGASFSEKPLDGLLPLQWGLKCGAPLDSIHLILDVNPKAINALDIFGRTVLHLAVEHSVPLATIRMLAGKHETVRLPPALHRPTSPYITLHRPSSPYMPHSASAGVFQFLFAAREHTFYMVWFLISMRDKARTATDEVFGCFNDKVTGMTKCRGPRGAFILPATLVPRY